MCSLSNCAFSTLTLFVQHYPKTAAISEQRSSDCASSIEVNPRQAVTPLAALVGSPAADHIQVGSSDVQSSEHVHSGLSTLPNRRTCLQPNSTFICHPAAGPTIHENRLLQAYFPVFSTICLQLAATNSSHQ